jgi:hypothetical protein
MITIKAEVLKGKQKSDGTYNVKIRMTYKREVKRLPTSIYVRKEDLTKTFKIKNPKFIRKQIILLGNIKNYVPPSHWKQPIIA